MLQTFPTTSGPVSAGALCSQPQNGSLHSKWKGDVGGLEYCGLDKNSFIILVQLVASEEKFSGVSNLMIDHHQWYTGVHSRH